MASISDLGKKVKAKFPGAYDDMDDASVGRSVKAKFPGAYDDFSDAPAAPAATEPGLLERGAKKIGETLSDAATGAASLGQVLDPVVAAAGAAGSYLVPHTAPEGASFGDRFKNEMEGLRQRRGESFRRSPNAFTGGAILEGGAVAPALVKLAPFSAQAPTAATAVGTVGRAGAALADSALASGVSNAASNIDKNPGQSFVEGATSPANLIAPAISGAGELTPALAGHGGDFMAWLARRVGPQLEVLPEARALAAKGVPLTVGQMAPRSALGQIEAVSEHNPFGMKPEREAAKEAWRGLVRKTPLKAGDKAPLPADSDAAMADAYKRFGPDYEAIRSQPVPGETVEGMPAQAAKTQAGIDARTRAGVKAEVENAMTVLPGAKQPAPHAHGHGAAAPEEPLIVDAYGRAPEPPPPKPPPDMTAGDLMKVRENIRGQIRDARQAQDFDRLKLLEHAEDVVTGTMEGALPPETQAALRDADRRYAIYNVIEGAQARAGMEGNFTPKQLGAEVRKAAGRRAFVQGGGGELRDLAEQGNAAFADAPMTGYRGAVMGSIPWGHKLAAPVARWANTPKIKASLLRDPIPDVQPEPVPQSRLDPRMVSILQALREKYGPSPLRFAATSAEDDQ